MEYLFSRDNMNLLCRGCMKFNLEMVDVNRRGKE